MSPRIELSVRLIFCGMTLFMTGCQTLSGLSDGRASELVSDFDVACTNQDKNFDFDAIRVRLVAQGASAIEPLLRYIQRDGNVICRGRAVLMLGEVVEVQRTYIGRSVAVVARLGNDRMFGDLPFTFSSSFGRDANEALIELLSEESLQVRRVAIAALRRINGEIKSSHPDLWRYEPDGPAEARQAGKALWREWWKEEARRKPR